MTHDLSPSSALPPDPREAAAALADFAGRVRRAGPQRFSLSPDEAASLLADERALRALAAADDVTFGRLDVPPEVRRRFEAYRRLLEEGPPPALAVAFPSLRSGVLPRTVPGIVPRARGVALRTGKEEPLSPGDLPVWLRALSASPGIATEEGEALLYDAVALEELAALRDAARRGGSPARRVEELADYAELLHNGLGPEATRTFPGVAAATAGVLPGILPRLSVLYERVSVHPEYAGAPTESVDSLPAGAVPPALLPLPAEETPTQLRPPDAHSFLTPALPEPERRGGGDGARLLAAVVLVAALLALAALLAWPRLAAQ